MQDTQEVYYGMFTVEGNQAVDAIVKNARADNLSWLEVYQELCRLSEVRAFGEATDTMVREIVYDALNFNCDFYV